MSCSHCTANVEKALSMVSGIKKIEVSLEGNCAFVDGEFNVEDAETAIKNAGYTVTGVNLTG
jgi:copper chaperone CopZ